MGQKPKHWFRKSRQHTTFKFLLGLSTLALILSILFLCTQYGTTKGLKRIIMPIMPLIFAYLIYFYYSKIKATK